MKLFSLASQPFLVTLCLSLLLISCAQTPVQAEVKLDAQFEKQVLEVIRKNPEFHTASGVSTMNVDVSLSN